jgi:uncharacterized protein YdaU (DUF1376 family)
MHYYSLNIPTWALHTSHLTIEEECVYFRLLNYYYDTEKPLPKDLTPVVKRMRLRGHEDTVKEILEDFFTLDADGYHNHRADIEIAEYHKKADTARANGKKGGRPKNRDSKTQPVNLANPAETGLKANHKLRTNNHKQITKFIRPKPNEVEEYAQQIGFSLDGNHFCDYYEARGWKLSTGPMKDWKACVRTWKRNRKEDKEFKPREIII